MPPRIVLATLNSKYSHASFGLRYLMANLGEYRENAVLREFTIHETAGEILEAVLDEKPDIVGFGVYIWNVRETTAIIAMLKAVRPDVRVIIGGPEVSYEYEDTEIFRLADHLITGEADHALRELVDGLARGRDMPKVTPAQPPDVATLALPYELYTDDDLAHRLIYVEASRGCPFKCEFCLSSVEIPVRAFDTTLFLNELEKLLDRGARSFKFVDRTFNLNTRISGAILEFLLARHREGFELHFEMIPDRLPAELREIIKRFPPGAVQFEVGIQTFNEEISTRISRRQNVARIEENFAFLRAETGVHIHADLIFGLPGESLDTFADSFHRLLTLDPDEIQLGILKRLRGTPISRHTEAFGMVYNSQAPYEVLQTSTVPFATMQRMKRFARYFELYHNSGNFVASSALVYEAAPVEGTQATGPFFHFLAFADWLWKETGQTHQFALNRLFRLLFVWLTEHCGLEPERVADAMMEDWDRHKIRKERPEFLKPWVDFITPRRNRGAGEDEARSRKWGSGRESRPA